MSFRFSFKITGFLLTALLLFSCGQKGPLYIEEEIQEQEQKKTSEPVSQQMEKPVKQ